MGNGTLELDADPYRAFDDWFANAKDTVEQAEAATLATADADGTPSARIILLKSFDRDGLSFYTNFHSQKARDMAANPRAAMVFFWQPIRRQVRIEGRIDRLPDDVADTYFATRDRVSQIGAWASAQSSPIASRETLLESVEAVENRYAGETVPRPPHWGGYLLIPHIFEFWEARDGRLHERIQYGLDGDRWSQTRLSP